MIIGNGLTAAILTNQADYSTMPTVDPLPNTAATWQTSTSFTCIS
jgi:hypothetical protein